MAQQFNLTAQINLQSPKNVGKVVSDIQRQLKGSGLNTVNIKVKADPRSMAQTNRQLQNVSKNSRAASKDINNLNRSLQEATRRFSVITLATGTLLSFVTGFKNATKAAIEFERELLKISQVTGKSVQQLQGLTKEVTRLSTAFGVSSADLLNVSRTLAQAGFNAEKTRKSLDILAKTTLAATFDNIQDTTEGAIALLRQFGNEAKRSGGDVAFLEKSLSAINSVSKQFAVESGDLITVIRRVGGVFSAAGGSVNELIALFTSVRATTRESAETIATGLRTIFTRIQRTDTIQQLKALNIELQDSKGRFVGAFEAVRRLSQGLSALDPRDFRFSQIVEQLGGFRQIGKVIPLIQQFATAQQALTVAQNASGSVAKDAAIAQQGLGNQIAKVREEFTALIRKFSDSGPFNSIATGALKIASAMIKVAEAVEPLLPLLTTMFGLKLGRALAPGLGQLAGIGRGSRGGGGGFSRFARGGMVPGSGNRDTVPAMLTPGEFVIKKSSVKSLGAGTLAAMNQNRFTNGGKQRTFREVAATGGNEFTHLDKLDTTRFSSRLVAGSKNKKIARLYSNVGVDLPKSWNRDWGKPQRNNQGVLSNTLKSYIAAAGSSLFKTMTQKSTSTFFAGKTSNVAGLLKDPKVFGKIATDFAAGISSGQQYDVDADIIRANVAESLFASFGKNRNILEPFFKQVSTKKSETDKINKKTGKPRLSARQRLSLGDRPRYEDVAMRNAGGGISGSDTVPALLTPGEFVFNKGAAQSIGYGNLKRINSQGVQGFAKGGPVGFANGGPVNQVSGAGSAADILKAAEDEIDARKKSSEEIKKNTAEEKKDTQALTKHSSATNKSKEKLNQFASRIESGASSLSRIAQSAQSFVFLGASIGAVTAQMSGLEDTTKRAINETTAFVGGIVGIGATVIETFSSIVSNTILQATASKVVTDATLKEAAAKELSAKSSTGAAAGMGKISGALTAFTVSALVAITALQYVSAKQRAVADELQAGIKKALDGILEGRAADAKSLTQSAKEEVEARKKSAVTSSKGANAIAVSATAIVGFAAGVAAYTAAATAVTGPFALVIGAIAGVLAGLGALALALFGIDLFAESTKKAEESKLKAIQDTIQGIIDLRTATKGLGDTISSIDSAKGLEPEERLKQRVAAQEKFGSGSQIRDQELASRKTLVELAAGVEGKSFSGLEESDFAGDPEGLQQFINATMQAADAAKLASDRLKTTSETFAIAMQTASPSKTFDELMAEGGDYKKALDANIAAIRANSLIQRSQLAQSIAYLKATDSQSEEIPKLTKQLDDLEKAEKQAVQNTLDGANAAQKVANAQYEAARRTREASIALARSLVESGQFFDGLNKQLQSLEGEALAIDNFNAALDGAVFKFKEINIDEIDNLTNVKDLSTFAKQLADATKGAGPEAQKYVDQLTANAAAFKKAQEGGLLGLKRDPISDEAGDAQTKKILNDLGFSADNLGVGGEEIFAEMQSKLTEALKDGVIDPSEFQSIIGPAEQANAQAVDAAKKLVEIRQKEITNLQANLAAQEKLRQKEIEFREAQIDAIRKGVQRTEKAQEILAKSIDPSAEFTPQRGVETRLQNINAQNRLDTLGKGLRAGDIGGVTQARRDAQQRQEEIRNELGSADINETKLLMEEQAKLRTIINTTGDELKRLADRSSEAADIQGAMEQNLRAIEKERRAREQVTGVIEDFVVGGVEARRGLVEAATGVRQAFASGTLQMQTPEQRQATVGLLDRLGDVQLAGGMTGKEIKQELVFRDAVRLGLDPELAKAIALGTSTEEQLIDANRDLAQKMEQLTVATLLASQGLGNPFAALATGGMVQYRAGGGSIFKPKGTDTVPAMLSPGEFVIRKSAVDSVGADTLAAINDGAVYRDKGSQNAERKKRSTAQYMSWVGAQRDDKETQRLQKKRYRFSGFNEEGKEKWVRLPKVTGGGGGYDEKLLTDAKTYNEQQQEQAQRDTFQGFATSDSAGSAGSGIASEIGKGVSAGFRGSAAMLNQSEIKLLDTPLVERSLLDVASNPLGIDRGALFGFTDPDTGPRQRNVTGADAPKLEEYSQAQQFIGKVTAEAIEGAGRSTFDSALLTGVRGLDDFISGRPAGFSENFMLARKAEASGVGQYGETQRFGAEVTSTGGLGPSERELQKEREFEKERQELIAFNKKETNATQRHKAYTAQAEKEGKLKVFFDDDGFPNYNFLGMSDAELRLIEQGKDYNTGKLRENRQGGTDFWLAGEAKNELYRRKIKEYDRQDAERRAAVEAENREYREYEEGLKARDKALGIDKLDLETFEGRMEASKRRVRGAKEAEAAAEQQKVSAETSNPSDLPKAKAAEREAEKAVKDATKAQTEAKKQKQQQETQAEGAKAKAAAQSQQEFEDYIKGMRGETDAKTEFEDYIETVKTPSGSDYMDPTALPDPYAGMTTEEMTELGPLQEGRSPGADPPAKPKPKPDSNLLAKRKADYEARKDAKKDRSRKLRTRIAQLRRFGQIGGVTVDPAASFGVNAPMHRGFQPLFGYNMTRSEAAAIAMKEMDEESEVEFQAGVAAGAAAAGVQEERSLRQKRRDRAFGRRGITGTSSSRFRSRINAGRSDGSFDFQYQMGLSSLSESEKKQRYERILRMSGPAIAARYAQTIGYTPPRNSGRFVGSSQNRQPSTDQLIQQLLQQMLRQGGGNRGGITPRRTQYNAAGGSAGGADVIPAMLTPGEFVMSAGAVRQHGVGAMRSLNKGQIPRFNRGGMVGGVAYRNLGSSNAETVGSRSAFAIDTEGLDLFQQTFDKTVQGIASSLKDVSGKLGHFEMNHTFSGEVGLNVTGVNIDPKIIADQFSAAFTDMVKVEIEKAINNPEVRTPGQG